MKTPKKTIRSRSARTVLVIAVLASASASLFAAGNVYEPIDISATFNRGFADTAANDGDSGWTDQGPNDLRHIRGKQAWSSPARDKEEQEPVVEVGLQPVDEPGEVA